MTARFFRLLHAARPALAWVVVIVTSLSVARSDLPISARGLALATGAVVAFIGARRAERCLRTSEERLRAERRKRSL